MNTGFLHLCIYTFRYFEKEKQKINSLKISGFQCGKPTYSAKRLYLLRSLFWLCQSDILAVAKVILRLTPKLRRLSITFPRHTLLFWNRIIASGNAHSYACLRLFLHASTKVSCVGFIIRCPFREMRRMLLFWPTDCRKRQSVVLCLHTPFPREYTVSRGDPNLAMPRNDIVLRTQNNICSDYSPKKSEFWCY